MRRELSNRLKLDKFRVRRVQKGGNRTTQVHLAEMKVVSRTTRVIGMKGVCRTNKYITV